MVNKLSLVVIVSLLIVVSPARAIQEGSDQSSDNRRNLTKYEKFLNRSGSFILSKAYLVGRHKEGTAYDVSAMTAWEKDSSERIYAARFGGLIVDYNDLGDLQQELDKIIQALEKTIEKQDTTSMRYRALNGLECDYFMYEVSSGNSQSMARLNLRGMLLAGGSMNSVLELRLLISQVREKLNSLGAK